MRWLFLVVFAIACGRKEPAPPMPPSAPVVAVVADAAREKPVGWWRSDDICLELFANGDFQLNVMPPGNPKVQVIGSATVTPDGEGWKLELSVTRIFKARFIGNCRRYVSEAKDLDGFEVLGVTMAVKGSATLSLRIGSSDATLCAAARCATLHAETPRLVGRWDLAGDAAIGSVHWAKGDIVGISLGEPGYEYTSTLYVGDDGDKMESVNNKDSGKVTYVGPDQFDVPLATRHFTAKRLAGERIELCEGERCTTLVRRFDRDSTQLR